MTLAFFEHLPHDCCKFTYIAKVDIKGTVPKIITESGLAGVVNSVRLAYKYFERDEEVDLLARLAFIKEMETAPAPSAAEHELLVDSLRRVDYKLKAGT